MLHVLTYGIEVTANRPTRLCVYVEVCAHGGRRTCGGVLRADGHEKQIATVIVRNLRRIEVAPILQRTCAEVRRLECPPLLARGDVDARKLIGALDDRDDVRGGDTILRCDVTGVGRPGPKKRRGRLCCTDGCEQDDAKQSGEDGGESHRSIEERKREERSGALISFRASGRTLATSGTRPDSWDRAKTICDRKHDATRS